MLGTYYLAGVGLGLLGCAAVGQGNEGHIETVCGPLAPHKLGRALVHEHILVDFIGAEKISPDRYDADEVFEVMLPYLQELQEAGIKALFECTPQYLGRNPALLRRLSLATGLHLVTNTGWYKDPFLPSFAHTARAAQIAEQWIAEARDGIGPERIKPGFIKIAVNPGELLPIQQKIVEAAALTSKATGLAIACHAGHGSAALQALDILEAMHCPLERFIFVHADAEPDQGFHWQIAERGAWLEYDGIREENATQKLSPVREALSRYPHQLLISQDAGWYHVGEPQGGIIVPFDWLPRHFLPMLRQKGISEEQIEELLRENAARAFTVRATDD
ncbi:MAG: phosphotriesterase family protein [Candidatus Zipacnadales bacterium]